MKKTIDNKEAWGWADRLAAVGEAVRARIISARQRGESMAQAVAQEGGDTIFAIDRHVEPVIEEAISRWPADCLPVDVVAEGFGENGLRKIGQGQARYRVIIDPIDGTRNVMYDKRSAWFVAAVAENGGEKTRLAQAFASVIVELPTSKQGSVDVFRGVCGQATKAERVNLTTGQRETLAYRASAATTLKHGFAQVANFFPGTKVLASELMEQIVTATVGKVEPGSAAVFDDQYMTTAGQMVELMVGHDRFCCDLRPLFYAVLEKQAGKSAGTVRGLECHPYDCAGLLAARQGGVVLTDGWGQELDATMAVDEPVHWCGYANQALRQQIEPVIREFFSQRGVGPS
ncbi:MAG: hypothetical protein IT443_09700 [Phycisphaeraceae bacterium]|nr:hypothetical protein [Phycisphaeraceae bacterium]